MESIKAWGPLEHVIDDAIKQHDDAVAKGVAGPSLVLEIANAIRKANRDGIQLNDK